MNPFVLAKWIGGAFALGAALSALAWFVDAIGDRREANIRAEYDQALAATNVDISEHNSAESKVAAVAAAARAQALAEAAQAKGDKHPASKEQAEALNRISRRAP